VRSAALSVRAAGRSFAGSRSVPAVPSGVVRSRVLTPAL